MYSQFYAKPETCLQCLLFKKSAFLLRYVRRGTVNLWELHKRKIRPLHA